VTDLVWRLSLPEVVLVCEGRGRDRLLALVFSAFEGSENGVQAVAAREAVALEGRHPFTCRRA
jgi:hypothetical protein